MNEALDVYLYGRHVAVVERRDPSNYRLRYLDEWIDFEGAVPLSLSLPLSRRRHDSDQLSCFLDNLLPDNGEVRTRWAREAGLHSSEPFLLLREYGVDVAGALQFVPAGTRPDHTSSRIPIDERGIAERIRALRADQTSWRGLGGAPGQFSLGGAQGKFTLGWSGEDWYVPSGLHPTTHIFKPAVEGLFDGEIVEYLTMNLAREVGMNTARAELITFEAEHSLVVERFDRAGIGNEIVRLHQEDTAQALAVPPLLKYEMHGGPGYRDLLELMRRHVPEARFASSASDFIRSLIFSWMMLNTDAHAKNYSVFIRPDGIDLAPLYDVSSLIPYLGRPGDDRRAIGAAMHRTKLSMRIAADYEAGQQSWFEWKAVAREAGLDRADLTDWARGVAEGMPELIAALAATLPAHLQTDTVARFVELLPIRSAQLVRAIDG